MRLRSHTCTRSDRSSTRSHTAEHSGNGTTRCSCITLPTNRPSRRNRRHTAGSDGWSCAYGSGNRPQGWFSASGAWGPSSPSSTHMHTSAFALRLCSAAATHEKNSLNTPVPDPDSPANVTSSPARAPSLTCISSARHASSSTASRRTPRTRNLCSACRLSSSCASPAPRPDSSASRRTRRSSAVWNTCCARESPNALRRNRAARCAKGTISGANSSMAAAPGGSDCPAQASRFSHARCTSRCSRVLVARPCRIPAAASACITRCSNAGWVERGSATGAATSMLQRCPPSPQRPAALATSRTTASSCTAVATSGSVSRSCRSA
mmetsp:Transcript_29169/g.95168  ORF Transcript_29169/g.95168 Transcript_29169/m.95168 type:complete len:323 (-) Transcript_29169:274-1242(-)